MLICMHKINFINNVFLKILQRNTSLVTLSLFGHAWPHTSKVISTWRNLWFFFASKKSTLSFTFPLSFCKNIENLLFWALWTYLTIHTQWYYQLVCKTFVFFCRQKFKLHPCILLEILQIYAIKEETFFLRTNFLFWVLWACMTLHTQNGSINL